MLEELATLFPIPFSFSLGPLALGITLAVLVRLRYTLTDLLLNLKNRDPTSFDVAVLLSLPLFSVSTILGFQIPLDLSLPFSFLLGLYLLVDAATGRNEPRDMTIQEGVLVSVLQGIFLPRSSVLLFLFPLLLARDVRWKEALDFSLLVSLSYLLGVFLHPSLDVSTLLGFLVGLTFLALLGEGGRLPLRVSKAIYGALLTLMASIFMFLGGSL